jgi:inner membrane protein
MTGKTHFAVGLACGLIAVITLEPSQAVAMVGAAAAGALLPDLDSPMSTLGRLLPINPFAALGHRRILHSISMLIIFWLLAYYKSNELWHVYLLIGYTSHIILDAITVQGVPLWYPFPGRFKLPLQIRTGGFLDLFLLIGTWGGILFLGVYLILQSIQGL